MERISKKAILVKMAQQGMNHGDLCQKAKLCTKSFADIKNGKEGVSLRLYLRLANALNCKLGDLFEEVEVVEEEQKKSSSKKKVAKIPSDENVYVKHFHLTLLKEEYEILLQEFSKEAVDDKINEIMAKSQSYVKSYSSFSRIIKSWIKRGNQVKFKDATTKKSSFETAINVSSQLGDIPILTRKNE